MPEDPEKLLEELHHKPTESWQLTTCQTPSFHLKADAALPLGPATAKIELILGVEDGEVKSEYEAKLEGLLTGWIAAAIDESVSRLEN